MKDEKEVGQICPTSFYAVSGGKCRGLCLGAEKTQSEENA
jgi:hypothetical protein